jgi:hypothetical protein
MTIDERLDRLTERHEALTQSVELLAWTRPEHRQQIREMMEASAHLLRIAQIHEKRRTRLEGGEE